jgi:hypothetical protein
MTRKLILSNPPTPTHSKFRMDDDQDFPRDPATLSPFVCELMPANPDAMSLPDSEKYLGEKASDEGVQAAG